MRPEHLLPLPLLALVSPLALAQGMRFEDVSAQSGLFYANVSAQASIGSGDLDGDGYPDLVLAGSNPPRIFLNRTPLIEAGQTVPRFEDVSAQWMPADAPPASMAMFGDLDNDGDQDLVVVVHSWNDTIMAWNPSSTSVVVYENDGTRFLPPATPPGLGLWPRGHAGLGLADMDVDGDLDIVFVHKGSGALGAAQGPGFYLRNDGLPDLVDATVEAGCGLEIPRRHLGLLLADFSGDMLPDLHTSVDFYSDYHCHNLGGGKLVDVTTQVGATNLGSDMGLAFGDIENDGDLDIYSTNIDEGILYRNEGGGQFDKVTHPWIQPGSSVGWGTAFADFDHDGDEDLITVANGTAAFLFANDGGGQFSNVTPGSGLNLYGRSLVHFDFDLDGDLDVVIADNDGLAPVLYRNRSPALNGRHWLVVDPVGTSDNRDAIGTRIAVSAGGVTRTRWIVAGSSFHSAPPPQAHFGLGDEDVADEVRITWPSGQVQVLQDVPVDRVLRVLQP